MKNSVISRMEKRPQTLLFFAVGLCCNASKSSGLQSTESECGSSRYLSCSFLMKYLRGGFRTGGMYGY